MKIIDVQPNSLAANRDIQTGDDIIRINHHPVRDIIDYQFLISEELVDLELSRKGSQHRIIIEKESDENLGISLEEIKPRLCRNKCIFCFVDQNPPGLRKSLYIKDEDFRFSFLYGNYVTFTHITKCDLQRIVEQRLSPLYVSIHATDTKIRKQLLGLKKDDRLFEKLDFLIQNGIQLYGQIVLCPGYNDGTVLEQTIDALEAYFPQLASIAIVPVGLTKYRTNLPELHPVSKSQAVELIQWGHERATSYLKNWNQHWLFLADEFYLMSDISIPPAEFYDDFTQIENGVGMTRMMLDKFEKQQLIYPDRLPETKTISFVTGVSAYSFMREIIVTRLNKISNLTVRLFPVKNSFLGEQVTVTGLLTGKDIFQTLQNQELGDILYLPENCVNFDGLFLDDWTVNKLSEMLNTPVQLLSNDFTCIFENL